MTVLDIVLCYIAVILDPLLRQEVFCKGFLKKCVANVFFIPQDLFDVARVPFFVTGTVQNSIGHQATSDLQFAGTFQVSPEDAFDDLSFFRDDDQFVVLPAGVAQKPVTIDLYLTLLVAVLQAHFHILAQVKTTFLPKTVPGKTSVVTFLLDIVLGFASSLISDAINNQIEFPNPLNSPLLGSTLYLTFAALIFAALAGLVAVIQKKERAVSVYVIIPPGVVMLIVLFVFIIVNLVGPPNA